MTRDRRRPPPVLWFFAVATALLLSACLAALGQPLYAQQPDVADAPGSISGTVTDAAGVPLAGIRVTLDSLGDHLYRSPIFTDQDGQYAFSFLGAGIYKIGFSDPNALYGAEFYPGAARLDEAESIPVTGNDVTGIDAHLVVGGVITGTLTFAASPPRNWSLDITLWRYHRGIGLQTEHLQSASIPREDVTFDFAFGGLATDTYYLCVAADAYLPNDDVYDWSDVRTLNECYDDRAFIDLWHLWGTNTLQPNDLKPIDVQAGETTGAIDMVLGDPADRGSIAGQVQASDGRALQGIHVALISALAPDTDLRSTVSDEDGRYALADVAPGNYFLRACDETAEYVGRFYPDEDTDDCYARGDSWPHAAEVVALAPLETRVDLDPVLNPSAVVSGTVTLNGQVPPRARIGAQRLESGRYTYADSDSATGQYVLAGLVPGAYEITAHLDFDGTSLRQTYVTDDGQSEIRLGSGDRLAGIDVPMEALVYDWAIEGVVLGDGDPAEGIRVDLFKGGNRDLPLVYTVTDADGYYRIDGLAEDGYSFRFSDPLDRFATADSNDADTPYDPEWVVVRDERRTAVYNVTLPRAGTIHGRVVVPDGQPAAHYQVQSYFMQLFEYAPGQTAFVESRGPQAAVAADGAYTLHGLYPGIYRVGLEDPNGEQPAVFYPQASFNAAKNLHLAAGDVVSDINFYPGRGQRVYLPLMPGQ